MTAPRIAHLVYDLIRGGTEGQCARMAIGLAQQGQTHRVAVFHRRGFFLDDVEAVCGPVHEVRIRHAVRWETWREIRRLASWLRETKADILHTWDADAAIFGQLAAQLAGVALVTSRRDLGQIYPRWKLAAMRRADCRAARVVANCLAVREHFVAQGLVPDKAVVIPNLMDVADFDARAQCPFSKSEQLLSGRRLVVVNRLDPEKNVGLLIEALAQVRKDIPEAVLIIAGDGPQMASLQAQVAALKLEGAVCFLGDVHDVPALLRQCEIGALVPTHNEGLSNTILEYMAAGLPVIATDCGGNRELIGDGGGCLLPRTATPDEVAKVWVHLLQQQACARTMGEKGRETVVRMHAPQIIFKQFSELYLSVAGIH